MNTAIIIAGGRGARMGLDTPKQFVLVNERPVIIYALQAFENHPSIDSIGVVCLEGWEGILHDYATRFGICKLDWIIPGGYTTQESILAGVLHLEGRCQAEDIVIIHDGIRPLVETTVISDVLAVCKRHGNAVTALPYNEQIFQLDPHDPTSTVAYIPRDNLRRVSTPQAYRFGLLLARYREAFQKGIGIGQSSYANTMMADLGVRLYFSAGSERNIKLTTPDDLALFTSMLAANQAQIPVLEPA
ncbi:MAG: 2-C-methyl-D-erythritol 4-phosphate cytidylyltransferase [Propionibacteriaceae bacterium]|jgi:2-C-methyl-D-erythritol 4-phosphate cytidylyltransferase|nr:2-C-methyl-D-erythritol 4-phosphate cytidylyltransferase [Propionibacteriaceae bacterium]